MVKIGQKLVNVVFECPLIYCKIGIAINFRLFREKDRMAELAKALVKEKRVSEKKDVSRQSCWVKLSKVQQNGKFCMWFSFPIKSF